MNMSIFSSLIISREVKLISFLLKTSNFTDFNGYGDFCHRLS